MSGELVSAAFADRLRRAGVAVTTRQVTTFVDALALVGPERGRSAAHATLACSPDDVARIDEVLEGRAASPNVVAPAPQGRGEPISDDRAANEGAAGTRAGTVSAVEVLGRVDLARCTDQERRRLRRLMRRAALVGDRRRSRRLTPSRGRGQLDVRRTVRRALRTDAELVVLRRRSRRLRSRTVVMLIDVSGSMEAYARAFLQLGHVSSLGPGRVEVFALGTRLTRLTRMLSHRDPDLAFGAAVRSAADWGGGTRLGDTLRVLNDDSVTEGMTRGATVVVVSDGLDSGDSVQLDEQMARLARRSHRLIWVNPLYATEGYEPRAVGMRTALRHVDEFVDGSSMAAIEDLAARVRRPRRRREAGHA
jgi:uncharacterized protein with von Willebrand factor type A (vWA) domain